MKTSRIAQFKAGTAPLVLGLALIATPAFAQDAAEGEDEGGDIVVTGSLIQNPNLEQATPVNVTTSDEIDLQQSNLAEEVLREIPGVVPSIGSAVNNGNGGASFVNLRGLGSNRNIVLLDGQRIVPAELNGRTDLNNIPLAVIERVDVLTGGASATYGADAITGVVNFITNNDFTGLEANVGYQITEEGDGGTLRADLTIGAGFDDGRGNVVIALGYQEADPIYQGARAISINNIDSFSGGSGGSGTAVPSRFSGVRVGGAGGTNGTYQINPAGTGFNPTTAFTAFNFNPFNIFQTPFERFNIYAAGNYEVSDAVEVYTRGLFSRQTVDTIIAPSGSFGIGVNLPLSNPFLNAGLRNGFCAFDVNPNTAVYTPRFSQAECDAAATATDPNSAAYREIGRNNVFVPNDNDGDGTIATGEGYFNNPQTALFRRGVELGPRISSYQTTVFDYRMGLRGGITDTINWDISGSYGESENVSTIQGYYLNSRIRQSLLATNANTCLDVSNGCVPVNFFTPTATIYTAAQLDFLSDESQSTVRTSLAQARAGINGDFGVSSPWAEDAIAFAVGGEFRDYFAQQFSDTLASSGDLAGAGGATPPVRGGYSVYEAFGEIVIPLVQDVPFFQDLTLNAGIRYSDYSINAPGNPNYQTTTWTVGGSWTPVEDLRFRGNYSRAVRAPNIAELFSPQNTGLTNLANDPCAVFNDAGVRIRANPTGTLRAVCLAQGAGGSIDGIAQPIAGQANATGGGNLLLGPETSDSWTLGAVFEPNFIPGLAITVDYYDIEITGAITSPTPGDAISACFDGANLDPTNPACLVIRRDPLTGGLNGDPATTGGLFLALSNLGTLATNGVDFTINYRRDIGFADLSMAFVGNWTDSSTFQSSPGGLNRECVGLYGVDCASIQPEWQWSVRTTLSFDDLDLSLLWRHIDNVSYQDGDAFAGTLPASVGPDFAGDTVDFNQIEAYDYFDLTARFNVSDNLALTFSVQNLFDRDPPLVGSTIGSTAFNSGNTYPSTYDSLGRRYAVAARLRF